MKKWKIVLLIIPLFLINVYAASLTSSSYAVSVGFNVDGSTQTTLSAYSQDKIITPSDEGAATSIFGIYNRFVLQEMFEQNIEYEVNVTYTFDEVFDLNFIDNFIIALNSSSNKLTQFCSTTTSPDGITPCFSYLDLETTKISDYSLKITYKFIPKEDWGYVAIYSYPNGSDGYYNSDLRIIGNSYITISNVNYTKAGGGGGTFDSSIIEETNEKLDDVNENIKDTNEKLDKIDETITDNTPPDTSSLENAAGWLPAGPVDSLLTLPITLLQTLSNNLGSSCSPINLPVPFVDSNLSLACPSTLLDKFTGFTAFWNSFGLIAGGWLLYKYFVNLYKWVDQATAMNEKEQTEEWGGV